MAIFVLPPFRFAQSYCKVTSVEGGKTKNIALIESGPSSLLPSSHLFPLVVVVVVGSTNRVMNHGTRFKNAMAIKRQFPSLTAGSDLEV